MTGSGRSDLRPDIQALRAIAVASVFLYHLWPRRLPGGYTGVDVFFVISGFLICGNLLREGEATGRIQVLRFWSRRMRRLLPAALLVLAASSVATFLVVPQNLWASFFREIIASTFYVENWLLAGDSVDYLAAKNAASPVQHFWTLSVEEQFYIVTPLLLLGILMLARNMASRRRAMFVGLASITALSFGYAVWLTATSGPSAYFTTTTRAWEFAAGGLLAFVPMPDSRRVARLGYIAGLALIASAAVLLSAALPFPGPAAAWPVAGAALMIWSGAHIGGLWARAAAIRPVRWLGDVSYAVYLWHWPLIVLLPFAIGESLGAQEKVAIVAATLLLAGVSTRFVEDPIRFSPRLLGGRRSIRTVMAWSGAGMLLVAGVATGGLAVDSAAAERAAQGSATIERDVGRCLGARALEDPEACSGVVPPDLLVPDPVHAGKDTDNLPACWSRAEERALRVCNFGPADADVRLAAIGDSHSNALIPAFREIAAARGWRIDLAGHNGCYWTVAVQEKPTQEIVDACEGWKDEVDHWLDGQDPYDAIVVTMARSGALPVVEPGQDQTDVTVSGLVAAWAPQQARGARIIAIRDNPNMQRDVVACVVRYRTAANDICARPAPKALGDRDALVEAARASPNARLIDLEHMYCPQEDCLVVIGNVVVYQDRDHITATWARSLAPRLALEISAALR